MVEDVNHLLIVALATSVCGRMEINVKKITLILLAFSLVLCGCYKKYENYYNYEEKIVEQSDHYNYKSCTGEIQEKNVDLKFEFSGTDTIWTIESDSDIDLKCLYSAKIDSGKFKMVLISPDKSINTEVEGSTDVLLILQLKPGTNIVKISGVNCKGQLNMKAEEENLSGIKIQANDKKEFPWN